MLSRLRGIIGDFKGRAALVSAAAIVVCLGSAASSHGGAREGVLNVRFGGDQNETRVVIELDRSAKGRLIAGHDDSRTLSLGLGDVSVAGDLQGRGQGLVSAWTVDNAVGGARIKLQFTRPTQIRRRFLLPPSDGVLVYRYVVDLQASGASPAPSAPVVAPAVARPADLIAVSTAPALLHLKKVIVIDALKTSLERSGHYKVVMTRDSDNYVPLETRVQIARRADADLFISLHSDSGPDDTARGATVYTLSDKGSDRVVRNVMAENDWFINVNMPGRDRAVNQILLDLTQRVTRNRSAAFAENLLDHIGGEVQLQHRSHRDAGFVVLLAPDVPAVLLEMGYINNAEDEQLLNDPGRRGRFMAAVARSIDDYFNQQTRLASR